MNSQTARSETVGTAHLLAGSAAAFRDACRRDIARARTEVERLKSEDDPLAVVVAYDTAVGLLEDAAARAELARSVHPSEEMRQTAELCEHEAQAASTALSLDREVYDALRRIDATTFDAATQHYLDRRLDEFRRAGVDRDPTTRDRLKKLREELVTLGQEFSKNIREDVRRVAIEPGQLEGLPADYVRAHPPGADGKVVITTDNTDYRPFIAYAKSSEAREALWRAYRMRGHPKNLDVLARLLDRRRQVASLLGFADWADYITGDKMVGSRQHVVDFIGKISAAAERRAADDYAELLARHQQDVPDASSVSAWDSGYLEEQVKAAQYECDSQVVRPYFEYERVKQGVLDTTSQLFGISYRAVTDALVWHSDVEVYDVLDDAVVLGRIYLDMHPREGKYKHYAQFTLASGRRTGPLPEGVLVCNFPRPGQEPALLQHSDAETLFHEFGHLLHHVLGGHTRWAGLSGVRTEWDFVEVPSQLLEEWAWDPDVLRRFARHHETDEPIPTDLVRRMKAADEFGKGLTVRQQMFYAATSLELHTRDPRQLDTTRLVAELQERHTPFTFVEGTYFHASFDHLTEYSAIYYTYMWSLVIAKDVFTAFHERGLMDPETAARYRRAVLEPGGSRPAASLIEDFLGRPHRFEAYEAWLNSPR